MDSFASSRTWLMRGAFLGLALVILFFHLLPLNTAPRSWAPPDLLIGFAFAWVVRRPDYVPPLSIAAAMLMADLMLQRPPGLMALLVVLACEYLRSRAPGMRETGFLGEWMSVCLALLGVTVLNALILGVLAVQQAPLTLNLIQMVLTMLIYPLLALITQSVLGVRRLSPGDAVAMGIRS